MLLSGCAVHEERSNAIQRDLAQDAASDLHRNGAVYILALFDNAFPSPNFHRFFLEWLLQDPNLGILIKPKKPWIEDVHPELTELFARATATKRLCMMDVAVWPADAALAADFSVGHTSLSAAVVSALAGARILFLDYARLDREPLTKYATLHSLGPKRCVFFDHETLRHAALDYFHDPSCNPHLGDAMPVLDQFDPFRDGRASQRIGEYVQWYMEGIDKGASRDDALYRATGNYADKWGEDKVMRGL